MKKEIKVKVKTDFIVNIQRVVDGEVILKMIDVYTKKYYTIHK
jgi:hypothetical protein